MTRVFRYLQPIVVVGLALLARWIHVEYRAPASGTEGYAWHIGLGLLFALVAAVMDSPTSTTRTLSALASAAGATLMATGIAATVILLVPDALPRFAILLTSALFFAWLLLFGTIAALHARRTGRSDRVLAVVSAKDALDLLAEPGDTRDGHPFHVVATLVGEEEFSRIKQRCAETNATVLVLGPKAIISPVVIEQAEPLHRHGVRVRSLERFYDERLGKLPLSSLDSFALMGDIESLHGGYAPLKRAIDLVLASLGAVVLALLMPFVMLGNLVGNRGPLLFRQERIGLFGEPFSILKLRTMVPGAVDVSGWTSNNDPRITVFGKLLRRTHIDELPQVINIFIGELSVVGPRPEQVTYVRQLEKSLPFYAARHLVSPGLTGWAQVKYPYAASEEDAFIKLQYDLHYVRHESLTTDLRIIWLTFRHVLVGAGR